MFSWNEKLSVHMIQISSRIWKASIFQVRFQEKCFDTFCQLNLFTWNILLTWLDHLESSFRLTITVEMVRTITFTHNIQLAMFVKLPNWQTRYDLLTSIKLSNWKTWQKVAVNITIFINKNKLHYVNDVHKNLFQ